MAGEHILVVEDEPAVARGLLYGLKNEGFVTYWAENGQAALDIAHDKDVQLILLDIRLPDISGFDVCRQLRAEGKRQPIIMLTASDDEVDKVLGLELGADDYVVKPYSLREVISRIRAMLRRAYGELATGAEPEKLSFGNIVIDVNRLQVQRNDQPINLTPTEFRLLRYLVSNPDRPISRDTLIEMVWGYGSDIGDDRTIDVHIRHLREKLEDDPTNPRWLLTVRGFGYKFRPDIAKS
ncbi:MAG: response regulator transcription factor [Chloroflexi bacterium]|nr:response regulator transcription factor [Chloroflexota bacterium]MCL5275415.1 response regulator transcription factor [Chloroflexota bacterium]